MMEVCTQIRRFCRRTFIAEVYITEHHPCTDLWAMGAKGFNHLLRPSGARNIVTLSIHSFHTLLDKLGLLICGGSLIIFKVLDAAERDPATKEWRVRRNLSCDD